MSHRCIKPQCPIDCSECNHALPEEDEAAMLVCELLDDFAVDGFGAPLEDGESELVDRWRAWLAARHVAKEAIKQHDAEPVAYWNGKGSIIPAEDVQYLPNWTDYYPYPLFASPQPTKGEQ